jgi:hypothetical protein
VSQIRCPALDRGTTCAPHVDSLVAPLARAPLYLGHQVHECSLEVTAGGKYGALVVKGKEAVL